MISNNCDRLVIIAETFFIGFITLYFGFLLDPAGWNISSLILMIIGSLFILGGLIFVAYLSRNKQTKQMKPNYEYMRIDSLV